MCCWGGCLGGPGGPVTTSLQLALGQAVGRPWWAAQTLTVGWAHRGAPPATSLARRRRGPTPRAQGHKLLVEKASFLCRHSVSRVRNEDRLHLLSLELRDRRRARDKGADRVPEVRGGTGARWPCSSPRPGRTWSGSRGPVGRACGAGLWGSQAVARGHRELGFHTDPSSQVGLQPQ